MKTATSPYSLPIVWLFCAALHATLGQGPVANFPVKDCGINRKQCVGSPDSGCVTFGNCVVLLKYLYDPATEKIMMELYGIPMSTGSSNFWIASGFNEDNVMSGALVSECVYNHGQADVFSSYNSQGYVNRRLPDPKENISDIHGTMDGSILHCSFTLNRVRRYSGRTFDLSSPHYVLLGNGPANDWNLLPHQSTPFVSSDAITLALANQPSSTYSNLEPLMTISPVPAMQNLDVTAAASSPSVSRAASEISLDSITQGCGKTKGCIGYPAGCVDSNVCQAAMSYTTIPDKNGEIEFELWRNMQGAGDQYVAVGFGAVSNTMDGACVVGCVGHGNALEVLGSYNPSKYNVPLDNPRDDFTVIRNVSDGQRMYCRFSMPTKKSFRARSVTGSPIELDLINPYFLMLAFGPARPNGQLSPHRVIPLMTAEKINLKSFAAAKSSHYVQDMYKSHAGLMVAAWMFLASVGILTARYYKTMWLDHQPFGLKMWFHIHRPFMLLAVAASIAGFVIIFVVKKGQWTETPASVNAHPIVGMIAFILALIQPIMAFFRPNPGAKNRPLFNWAHFAVGFSAHILAIAAIYLGLQMPQMSLAADLVPIWIMVAFSAFHALWLIILQVIDWCLPYMKKKQQNTMQLKTVSGNGAAYQETTTTTIRSKPGSTLKTVMWVIHFIVVAGFTIAILVLIGFST